MDDVTYDDIMRVRKELGLTVGAFCDLVGIAHQTYYTFKNQRNPKGTLKKLILLMKNHPNEMLLFLREVRDGK